MGILGRGILKGAPSLAWTRIVNDVGEDDDGVEMFDPKKELRTCSRERTALCWRRTKYTTGALMVYLIISFLSIFVLAWELAGAGGRSGVAISIEIFINTFLITDVALDIVSQGCKTYWSSWGNVFDFVITMCCLIFFGFFVMNEMSVYDNDLSYVDAVFLSVRYCFQIFRLFMISRHVGEQVAQKRQGEV